MCFDLKEIISITVLSQLFVVPIILFPFGTKSPIVLEQNFQNEWAFSRGANHKVAGLTKSFTHQICLTIRWVRTYETLYFSISTNVHKKSCMYFDESIKNYLRRKSLLMGRPYRVENRILPVVFFFDRYGMLQDIELIFCIEALQTFI